jgi:hypothetical protein
VTLAVGRWGALSCFNDSSARSDGKKSKKRVGAEVGEPSQRRCTVRRTKREYIPCLYRNPRVD